MFALRWLLMAASVAMFGTAAGVVGYDVYLAWQFLEKLMGSGEPGTAGEAGPRRPLSWRARTSPHPSLGTRREAVRDWRGCRCFWL